MQPIMYDFRSLAGLKPAENKENNDLAEWKEEIRHNFDNACALFSHELFNGILTLGMKSVKHGDISIGLQHFRTPGIDNNHFNYFDEKNNVGCIFFSKVHTDNPFKVMQFYRVTAWNQPSDILFCSANPIVGKEADLAFLRQVSSTLAANIRATFDAAFKR